MNLGKAAEEGTDPVNLNPQGKTVKRLGTMKSQKDYTAYGQTGKETAS